MEGRGAVYGDGTAAFRQTPKLIFSSHNQPVDYVIASSTSKYSLASGSTSMLSFGAAGGVKRSGNSVFQSFDQEEIGDEYLDEYFNQPEKKKRLTLDQIQFLEKSFEADNKLEPDRKVQLAKELSLQPRQISVWFQNRRARWKTRQLETDYETLHSSYTGLKIDYDNLLKENEKLKAEVLRLKCNGIARDTNGASLRLSEVEELSEAIPKEEATALMISEDEESKLSATAQQNEEQSSAQSDITNVESPRLTDGTQSPILESGDSFRVFEPDQSDISQNGGDDLIEDSLLSDYIFAANIEDAHCHTPVSSFYYGFPIEDNVFGFWSS